METGFASYYGIFNCTCIQFDLKNALAAFQGTIDANLSTVQWQLALVYLNGIVIFQKARRHISNACNTSWRFFAMLASLSKWTVRILLHRYQIPGSCYSPWTIGNVTTHHRGDPWREVPNDYCGTTIIPGPVKCFWSSAPNLAHIAAPFHRKLRKDQPMPFWNLAGDELFPLKTLPQNQITPTLLVLLKSTSSYILYIDVCDGHIGFVFLQQKMEGPDKRLDIGRYQSTTWNPPRILRTKKELPYYGPSYYWRHIWKVPDSKCKRITTHCAGIWT